MASGRMDFRSCVASLALAIWVSMNTPALAATLKGTVRNGTTGKTAAGLTITLHPPGDTAELARTRTDARGRFHFSLPGPQISRLVRVDHQGVAYDKPTAPGTTSVDIQVFEAADQLVGVRAVADVQRYQAAGETLQAIEQILIRNSSSPPRTLLNEHAFEIELPAEAQSLSAAAQYGDSPPETFSLAGSDGKHRYSIALPLRPGDTRFQIAYRMPYQGAAVIRPRLLFPLDRLAVALPRTMQFEPAVAGTFRPVQANNGDNMQLAEALRRGQSVAFRLSGEGRLAELGGGDESAQDRGLPRPGGGLGPPTELPDPLHAYRWPILGGLSALLAIGAVRVRRQVSQPTASKTLPAKLTAMPGKHSGRQMPRHARPAARQSEAKRVRASNMQP